MKLNYFVSILILLNCSCSKNTNIEQPENNNVRITKKIFKSYVSIDSNYEVIENPITRDSIEYILENNQIISYSGIYHKYDEPKVVKGNLTYQNGKIQKVYMYQDNNLYSEREYIYDNDDNLLEVVYYSPLSSDNQYSKKVYTQINDTIQGANYYSSDGINFLQNPVHTKHFVLDENDNRIYYEKPNITNFYYNYNFLNNNLISFSSYYPSTYTVNYSDVINIDALILKNTFGKKFNSYNFGNGGEISSVFYHYSGPYLYFHLFSDNIFTSIDYTNPNHLYPITIEADILENGYPSSVEIFQAHNSVNKLPLKYYSSEFFYE